jgi:peptide/nickel transport system permease protein
MTITVTVGVSCGLVSALKRNSIVDYSVRFANVLFLSIPGFWLATLMLLLPSLWLGYAPPVGYVPFWANPLKNLEEFYMPAFALGMPSAAVVMRMTRSAVLEVLYSDYVRTARAKGLHETGVIGRHVLKNSMLPVLSVVGLQAAVLIGGQVIIEQIFTLPGIGRLFIQSVQFRDYNVVQSIALMIAVSVMLINLLIDLLYPLLDPQITYV